VLETDSFKPFRVKQPNLDFGSHAVMCDGSIRFIKTGIPDALFKAMVTYRAGDSTEGIDEWAPKVQITSRLIGGGAGQMGPAGPPQYLPKDWQPISLRILKATFGVAIPPTARVDTTADRSEEKQFTAVWPGKNVVLGAHASHRPGLPTSDPTGAAAEAEIAHYADIQLLTRDGSVTDAPLLGPSKGKQFRVKTADPKQTAIYRLWVVHEARLVLSVTGPADMKPADAEEYFKTAVAAAGGTTDAPRFNGKDWHYWYSPSLHMAFKFPGSPAQLGDNENLYLFWPKEVEGGAMFTLAIRKADLDPTIDADKAYKAMEKAAQKGQFGEKPKNLRRKFAGERPGVMYDELRGDTPYVSWAVYNNEETAIVMSVRKNAGLSTTDEKIFFDSLLIGIDQPPEELRKKDNPGAPGAPNAGAPGVPPGVPPGGPMGPRPGGRGPG
jgi:hypothetical protein